MPVHCIGVTAQPDPGALARVLEPFCKLGLIPLAVQTRFHEGAVAIEVDLQIAGITPDQCARIANQLRSMPVVLDVITGERHRASPVSALR